MEMLLWKFPTHLASETSSVQTVLTKGMPTEVAGVRWKEKIVNDPDCDIMCENFLPLIWHHRSFQPLVLSLKPRSSNVMEHMSFVLQSCSYYIVMDYQTKVVSSQCWQWTQFLPQQPLWLDKGRGILHANDKKWKENSFLPIFLFSFSSIHSSLQICPVDRLISGSICKAIRVVSKTTGH